MRCSNPYCDVVLSDFEATRKREDGGEYLDLCNYCFSTISNLVEVIERFDLYEGEYDESDWISTDEEHGRSDRLSDGEDGNG